ncbi:LAMI_0B01222g1_1 [Lachancea mirantina]|uniref:LAMI_0B01222g1_1 n=1 Tax=Lachancea mirantina TaxID=1230905 RepID=A0A1G4ITJ5_9SACH|nr:LAMI_0B01222g1_1 [Lachancea mirantina]
MEIVERVYNNVVDTFAGLDPLHVIRLVVIVGGYIMMRNVAQKYLAKKQLEHKLKESEAAKQNGQSVNDSTTELLDAADESDATFGWGKKTRKRVQKQQQLLEERLEELKRMQGEQDDDKDIEDLLEE